MLPNIRAVLGASAAAIALLMLSFGLVATFRVAQETRVGLVQADLAQRGRSFFPAGEELRTALPIDIPAPLEANPVRAVEIQDAPEIPQAEPEIPVAAVLDLPQAEPPATELPATEQRVVERPSAEPPMGGPLPDETVTQSEPPLPQAVDGTAKNAKKKAAQARKARAQRIARERKAAARRAAQARAKQEQSAGSFNAAPFGNSFGIYGNNAFSGSRFGAAAIEPQPRSQSPAQNAR